MEWLLGVCQDILVWGATKLGQGVAWVGGKGTDAILETLGVASRFIVTNCESMFLLFGFIGVFFVMANNKEMGIKFIQKSLLFFIILQILGACL